MASTSYPVVVSSAGNSVLVSNDISIDKVRWVGASTAGHQVEVKDKDGNSKFKSIATGSNYVESETFTTPLDSQGLVVPTLDSGVLYIYILNR